jgi:hypothetical protein
LGIVRWCLRLRLLIVPTPYIGLRAYTGARASCLRGAVRTCTAPSRVRAVLRLVLALWPVRCGLFVYWGHGINSGS